MKKSLKVIQAKEKSSVMKMTCVIYMLTCKRWSTNQPYWCKALHKAMIVFKSAISAANKYKWKRCTRNQQQQGTHFLYFFVFHQNTHARTHICEVLPSRWSLSIQRRQQKKKKTIYMQIKPYHLNLFMPLSPAKLHSYAQRHSITVAVAQLFTSQHFLFGEAGPCTFNR